MITLAAQDYLSKPSRIWHFLKIEQKTRNMRVLRVARFVRLSAEAGTRN